MPAVVLLWLLSCSLQLGVLTSSNAARAAFATELIADAATLRLLGEASQHAVQLHPLAHSLTRGAPLLLTALSAPSVTTASGLCRGQALPGSERSHSSQPSSASHTMGSVVDTYTFLLHRVTTSPRYCIHPGGAADITVVARLHKAEGDQWPTVAQLSVLRVELLVDSAHPLQLTPSSLLPQVSPALLLAAAFSNRLDLPFRGVLSASFDRVGVFDLLLLAGASALIAPLGSVNTTVAVEVHNPTTASPHAQSLHRAFITTSTALRSTARCCLPCCHARYRPWFRSRALMGSSVMVTGEDDKAKGAGRRRDSCVVLSMSRSRTVQLSLLYCCLTPMSAGAEQLVGGACVAGDPPCADSDDCTDDECDEQFGTCFHKLLPANSSSPTSTAMGCTASVCGGPRCVPLCPLGSECGSDGWSDPSHANTEYNRTPLCAPAHTTRACWSDISGGECGSGCPALHGCASHLCMPATSAYSCHTPMPLVSSNDSASLLGRHSLLLNMSALPLTDEVRPSCSATGYQNDAVFSFTVPAQHNEHGVGVDAWLTGAVNPEVDTLLEIRKGRCSDLPRSNTTDASQPRGSPTDALPEQGDDFVCSDQSEPPAGNSARITGATHREHHSHIQRTLGAALTRSTVLWFPSQPTCHPAPTSSSLPRSQPTKTQPPPARRSLTWCTPPASSSTPQTRCCGWTCASLRARTCRTAESNSAAQTETTHTAAVRAPPASTVWTDCSSAALCTASPTASLATAETMAVEDSAAGAERARDVPRTGCV